MAKFYTEVLPNSEWRFELYINSDKLTAKQIVRRTHCDRLINLGYFNMRTFQPTGGLIVGGKVKQYPAYKDWGVTIDADGNLGRGAPKEGAGKLNWCPAMPPELKAGKKAAAAQWFERNGTTMIGFRADGTPVWLIALKAAGKTVRSGEGATSDEAIAKLVQMGCVDVLRYDGSWSTQAYMNGQWYLPGQYRVVHNLLLAYRRGSAADTKEEPTASVGTAKGKTMVVNTRRDPLLVRSSPEAPVKPRASNVVGSLPKGTSVTVLETKNGWARIGKNRWVSATLLK